MKEPPLEHRKRANGEKYGIGFASVAREQEASSQIAPFGFVNLRDYTLKWKGQSVWKRQKKRGRGSDGDESAADTEGSEGLSL